MPGGSERDLGGYRIRVGASPSTEKLLPPLKQGKREGGGGEGGGAGGGLEELFSGDMAATARIKSQV